MRYWIESGARNDEYILSDSDCIFVRSADELLTCLRRDGHVTIDIGLSTSEEINGISRREAAELYRAFGYLDPSTPLHISAENFML